MPRLSKKTMFAIEAVLDVAFHVGDNPATAFPAASFGVAPKRTTSPVRAVSLRGVSSTSAMVLAMTCTAELARAGASAASIIALPGATAVIIPSESIVSTRGALDVH